MSEGGKGTDFLQVLAAIGILSKLSIAHAPIGTCKAP